VKEKLLGAHRAGITDIILPKENEKDLEEVPGNVRKKLDIHLCEHMDEVLRIALGEPAAREEEDVTPPPETLTAPEAQLQGNPPV
jgi:ATP-dependent Lon protease